MGTNADHLSRRAPSAKMATHREVKFPDIPYIDNAPMPKGVPKVDELGATSAPLKTASFFIGAYCKDYNEDFMLCNVENDVLRKVSLLQWRDFEKFRTLEKLQE